MFIPIAASQFLDLTKSQVFVSLCFQRAKGKDIRRNRNEQFYQNTGSSTLKDFVVHAKNLQSDIY